MTAHDTTAPTADGGLAEAWAAWRERRERDLRDPHGWLSLTALYWLTGEPVAFPGVPGRWSASGPGVRVSAVVADGLSVAGTPVDGTAMVEPVDGAPGVRASFGDMVVEVVRRGGRHAIRVRDPRSPTLARFTGVPTHPLSPQWRVEGRFSAYPTARRVTVGAVVDGLTHTRDAPGLVGFTVGGGSYSLVAFAGRDGGLSVPFRDTTNGVTTYAFRSLEVPAPDASGRVTLDFNRATNLPCAFTEYATCPVPPPENTLPFAVEAGELAP